jgi:hypothetical protein
VEARQSIFHGQIQNMFGILLLEIMKKRKLQIPSGRQKSKEEKLAADSWNITYS